MVDIRKFTAVERQILEVLFDGIVHPPQEIIDRCMDELSCCRTLRVHVSNMRKKLSSTGLLISFVTQDGLKGYLMSRRISRQ